MIKKRLAEVFKSYFKYFAFFYSYIGKRLFLIFCLSFLVGVVDALGLSMFIPLFEAAGNGGEGASTEFAQIITKLGIPFTVNNLLLLMVIFFSLKGVLRYVDFIFRNKVTQQFGSKIRSGLINAVANLRYSRFVHTDQGLIQNTVTVEVNNVISGYLLYASVVQNAIFLLVYIGLSFVSNWKFTLLIILGGYLSRLLLSPLYAQTRQISTKITSQNHVYLSQVLQQISNFKYLKSTGQMSSYVNKIKKSITLNENSQFNLAKISAIIMAFREPILVFFVCLTIFVQYNFVDQNLGSILLSLILFYRGFNSMMLIQSSWTGFIKYIGAIEHIQSFRKELLGYQESKKGETFPGFQNAVELNNVSFSFIDSTEVLKDISVTISKNTTVALVGKSGSGKTTLANLVSGILEPVKGEIRIDGKNIKDFDPESYRSNIGLISQETVVFNDSFYNNVTFWSDKTPENLTQFWDAVAKTDLQEFVEGLPENENTVLGDGGIIMSGGQRQRLSIARELFRKTPILILDEATSALDSQTERLIQENIDAIKGESTLLIIAHRLSTIKNADTILLLDHGRILSQGNFNELCTKSETFANMVALQEI